MKTEDLMATPISSGGPRLMRNPRMVRLGIVLLILLVGFFLVKKGYILAAIVNGKPITRMELNNQLSSRFGQQTLESMITERLIVDAAQKEGVVITQSDVDAKVATITSTLGPDVNLEELLRYQGMTKTDFEHQVRLQLTVEKVLGKDIAVEDGEVDAFIQTNRDTMTATDEAALKVEAREALVSQKTSEKMQPWLMELREKAKIIVL